MQYTAGEAVHHDEGSIAPSGPTQGDMPAGAAIRPDILRIVDDEPARSRELRGDGDRFRRREHPRRRRPWMSLDVATADEKQEEDEAASHALVNT